MFLKPVKKTKTQQASLTAFFDKDTGKSVEKGGKTATKSAPKPRVPSGKKPSSKKAIESDDDDDADSIKMEMDPVVEKRNPPPRRAARAAPRKYVEIETDDDDGGDSNVYEVSD